MNIGLTHVYTGNGKGKTTAMLGLAMRAVGAGMRVYIGQFLKDKAYSEMLAVKDMVPAIVSEQYGEGFVIGGGAKQSDLENAESGMKKATNAMLSGDFDMVALDEVLVAVHLGLISIDALLEFVTKKPPTVELILTGRYASAQVVAIADLVTDMVEVKHYYNAGVPARKGIEL